MITWQGGHEIMVGWQLCKQVRKSHYKKSFQGCVCTTEKCVKKTQAFDWLIKKWGEIPVLMVFIKSENNPFSPSVFLPKEWKFPVFPPWQPSVLALTHYTCVRAPTSINPLLWMLVPLVSTFSLPLVPIPDSQLSSSDLWWQSHTVSKDSDVIPVYDQDEGGKFFMEGSCFLFARPSCSSSRIK